MANNNKIIYINDRINKEICYDTINKLTDTNLFDEYKKCESVENKINELVSILNKYKIDDNTINKIIDDYLPLNLIPPGTKGCIKGIKFNILIKEKINNLNFDNSIFDIEFEKAHDTYKTSEKPDWFIFNKKTNKIIIGMNQLDLWSGGQQINRGSKYIIDNNINNDKCRLLCVICNEIKLKNTKNKIFNIFNIGFTNNTLNYINNLLNCSINSCFEIDLGPTVLLKSNFNNFNLFKLSSNLLLFVNIIK
jgi:hypothetical protein